MNTPKTISEALDLAQKSYESWRSEDPKQLRLWQVTFLNIFITTTIMEHYKDPIKLLAELTKEDSHEKKKTILDLIPDKPNYTVISARIPLDLFDEVNEYRTTKECSWNELITACLSQFAEEMKQKDNKH